MSKFSGVGEFAPRYIMSVIIGFDKIHSKFSCAPRRERGWRTAAAGMSHACVIDPFVLFLTIVELILTPSDEAEERNQMFST